MFVPPQVMVSTNRHFGRKGWLPSVRIGGANLRYCLHQTHATAVHEQNGQHLSEMATFSNNDSPPVHVASNTSRRKLWLIGGAMSTGLFLLVASMGDLATGSATASIKTHRVKRGTLLVSIKEEGTLESSRNTEIKCEVRGGYGGRGGMSTVTWVIQPGSTVKKGDELVRLDTKIIEETVSLGKTDTNNAKAALARAEADLATAKIAVKAYEQGRFRSQMKALEKQRKIAQWNLETAQGMLRDSESLFAKGFVTELEVKGNGYTVKQAELERNVVNTQIDVLSRLTRAMELETLNGQLTATTARVDGRKAGLELEQSRLDLAEEEFKRCTIRAPQDGLVIYPSTARWKNTPDIDKGASVHNNQILLLMPDLTQMQVKIGVHESIVDRVQPGIPAKITLPNQTLNTTVTQVASVATPANWWDGNTVRYDATIELPPLETLKPGMSATVEVVVARYEDVLSVPVGSIVETSGGHFCWVDTPSGPQQRQVELGDSNDQFIVVKSGVEENELVIDLPLDSVTEALELVQPTHAHTIGRGDVVVTLTEQGTLESSNNTVIKCRVRGSSTVNWVIDNGSEVEPGDELVRLENKQIEEFLHERTKFAFLSRDAAIGFRADATRSGLAISEYLEGRFRTELMTLEKDLAIAEERLSTAKSMLAHAQSMFERGYISEFDVEQRQSAVTEATLAANIKRTEIDVLKRFTKEEELETLKGNWEAAKAAANGHEEVLRMDEERMKLAREEMERCVLRADRKGLVIYPKQEEWKKTPDIAEGVTVHNDQTLLLMPDLTQMQVKVGIHESMIDVVESGMRARVTLPVRKLEGEVISVAEAAQPAGWWTGNMVKYDSLIKLPSVEGLKPGMSAEVEIFLAEHKDVLRVPMSAVVETDEGAYCWVVTSGEPVRRELKLGDSNDDYAIVLEGLREGDQVSLNP